MRTRAREEDGTVFGVAWLLKEAILWTVESSAEFDTVSAFVGVACNCLEQARFEEASTRLIDCLSFLPPITCRLPPRSDNLQFGVDCF